MNSKAFLSNPSHPDQDSLKSFNHDEREGYQSHVYYKFKNKPPNSTIQQPIAIRRVSKYTLSQHLNRVGINSITALLILIFFVVVQITSKPINKCQNQEESEKKLFEALETINNLSGDISDLYKLVLKNRNHITDMSDIANMTDWFAYKQDTNWISGVVRKPHIIPYAFNDGAVGIVAHSFNVFNTFSYLKRGTEVWLENKEDNYKKIMVDITTAATPLTLQPNDCLQFGTNKQNRWIELTLIEKIMPTQFEYIHIDKNKIIARDRNKSPKRFTFFGKIRAEANWTAIVVKEDRILSINESVIKLEFETEKGIELMRIEYAINEGAKTTRLYRMRLYGDPHLN